MKNDNPIDKNLFTVRAVPTDGKHNVIYSAATAPDGKIYLGLSCETDVPGGCASLCCYDPELDSFSKIYDLEKLLKYDRKSLRHPHSKIHTAVCCTADGKVFAATHVTAPPAHEDYYHYWQTYNDPARCFDGSHLLMYDSKTGISEDLGVVAPKCGCRWLGYNPDDQELYMTTFLTCHFLVIKLKTGEVKDLGRISQDDFMGPCYSRVGYVYTCDSYGRLMRYSPKKGTLETLPVVLPHNPWDFHDGNGLHELTAAPDGIKLYGAAYGCQSVFEFDPTKGKYGEIRDYGQLTSPFEMDSYNVENHAPRTFTVSDKKIYIGTKRYIREVPGAHIYTIDRETGEKHDYGLMQSGDLHRIVTPVASTIGHDGTVYIAAEQPAPNAPLMIGLFNENGLNKTMPPEYNEKYAFTPPPEPANVSTLRPYHLHCREHNTTFAAKGTVEAHELGYLGRSHLIPNGESVIGALALDEQENRLFGITGGAKGHLFVRQPLTRRILPLGCWSENECMPCPGAGIAKNNKLYWASQAGEVYSYDYGTHCCGLMETDVADRGEFTTYCNTFPGQFEGIEKVCTLTNGNDSLKAFTLSYNKSRFYAVSKLGFMYIAETTSGKILKVMDLYANTFRVPGNVPEALLATADGKVWFTSAYGYMAYYDEVGDTVTVTDMKIPVAAGREYLAGCRALCMGKDNMIYGGTSCDGYLFRIDPTAGKIRNLGKASNEYGIRAICTGKNGVIWAVTGDDMVNEAAHLVCYDPDTEETSDVGLLRSKIPMTWVFHKFSCMLTGCDGEIFFGENERDSHLGIYFPPIR